MEQEISLIALIACINAQKGEFIIHVELGEEVEAYAKEEKEF